MSRAGIVLGALALWTATSGQALAAPDILYPYSAAWTVNTSSESGVTNPFSSYPTASVPIDGTTTLNTDLHAGDNVVIATGWGIQNRAGGAPASNTGYPRTGIFNAATVVSSPETVTVDPIASCTVTSATSTCARNIAFTVPATAGVYSIEITMPPMSGGGQPLVRKKLTINFTVVEVDDIDTTVTVDAQCFLLKQGDVDLTATLTETAPPHTTIAGEQIDFSIGATPIGSAVTNGSGVATLMDFNVDDLAAGDHTLYGEFLENPPYNSSLGSATLGISYVFLGFGEPINGDGSSIFNGRAIPVKIRLVDANGDPVMDAMPTVWMQSMGIGGIGDVVEATSVSAADSGNMMRYSDGYYIYNFDTTGLSGPYKIEVRLGDSAACRAQDPSVMITVGKKSKK